MRSFVPTLLCALALTSPARANDGESSFTPTSFYVPLHSIMLINSQTNLVSELYHCNGNPNVGDTDAGVGADLPADCLVDMADNSALAALFTSTPIDIMPGTYDSIVIGQCAAGATGYSSWVKGQIELSGQTWYTTTVADKVLTTVAADNRHVKTDYSGCGSTIKLPSPITLMAGEAAVSINAFFSLKNIAWATLTSNGPPGGCVFDADTHNVCTGYPIPIAYLGADSPTLDTYFITEDLSDLTGDKAGGQLLLLRSGSGVAFGGFSRRLYSAHSVQPNANYDTPIKTLTLNPDGATYLIENWGGGGPGGIMLPYYVHFPAFQLATHNGTFTQSDGVTTRGYRAVLQP